MKKKPPLKAVVPFGDPNLSDRHLMLLLLYEVMKLRAELGVVQQVQRNPTAAAQAEKLAEFCHQQAFAELAEDIRQFETGAQRPDLQ